MLTNLPEITTRLEQTTREEIPTDYMTPLMHAAEDGSVDYVRRLLENGADANEKSDEHGLTALMFAARSGHIEIVKLLLEAPEQIRTRSLLATTLVSTPQ